MRTSKLSATDPVETHLEHHAVDMERATSQDYDSNFSAILSRLLERVEDLFASDQPVREAAQRARPDRTSATVRSAGVPEKAGRGSDDNEAAEHQESRSRPLSKETAKRAAMLLDGSASSRKLLDLLLENIVVEQPEHKRSDQVDHALSLENFSVYFDQEMLGSIVRNEADEHSRLSDFRSLAENLESRGIRTLWIADSVSKSHSDVLWREQRRKFLFHVAVKNRIDILFVGDLEVACDLGTVMESGCEDFLEYTRVPAAPVEDASRWLPTISPGRMAVVRPLLAFSRQGIQAYIPDFDDQSASCLGLTRMLHRLNASVEILEDVLLQKAIVFCSPKCVLVSCSVLFGHPVTGRENNAWAEHYVPPVVRLRAFRRILRFIDHTYDFENEFDIAGQLRAVFRGVAVGNSFPELCMGRAKVQRGRLEALELVAPRRAPSVDLLRQLNELTYVSGKSVDPAHWVPKGLLIDKDDLLEISAAPRRADPPLSVSLALNEARCFDGRFVVRVSWASRRVMPRKQAEECATAAFMGLQEQAPLNEEFSEDLRSLRVLVRYLHESELEALVTKHRFLQFEGENLLALRSGGLVAFELEAQGGQEGDGPFESSNNQLIAIPALKWSVSEIARRETRYVVFPRPEGGLSFSVRYSPIYCELEYISANTLPI
ncbi:hypothetical protein FVE85_0254 [Porphyridium purpureum]|uniref:Uncharacterized protein n=1 Tax=Porphyridium purpureum TaxID=35688 RepID=A0A5J4YZH5_PORPP|nr:hypothetical protein FVE85_0254 [Porphyridium purpureum]|eukprot:POR6992..scf208_2